MKISCKVKGTFAIWHNMHQCCEWKLFLYNMLWYDLPFVVVTIEKYIQSNDILQSVLLTITFFSHFNIWFSFEQELYETASVCCLTFRNNNGIYYSNSIIYIYLDPINIFRLKPCHDSFISMFQWNNDCLTWQNV